jgi:hypothetical protein
MSQVDTPDASIAAELYNPGFDANSNARQTHAEFDKHDISTASKLNLSNFADKNQKTFNTYTFSGHFLDNSNFVDENVNALNLFNINSNANFVGELDDKILNKGAMGHQLSMDKDNISGHDLLSRRLSEIKATIVSRLTAENRFTSEVRYYDYNASSEIESYARDLYSLQNRHGQGEFGSFNTEAPGVSIKDLNNATLETLTNAQGFSGLSPDNPLTFVLPNIIPFHDVEKFRIKSTNAFKKFGDIVGQDDIAKTESFLDGIMNSIRSINSKNSYSMGTLNSPNQPFDDSIFPVGLISYSVAGMVAMIGISNIYSQIIPIIASSVNENQNNNQSFLKNQQKRKILSQFIPANLRRIKNELGIKTGMYSSRRFANALSDAEMTHELFTIGLREFYGLDKVGKVDIGSMPKFVGEYDLSLSLPANVLDSPGYYASITRGIMRDINLISKEIVGASTLPGLFNLKKPLGSGVINEFADSFSLKFYITLVKIGFQMYIKTSDRGYNLNQNKVVNDQTSLDVAALPLNLAEDEKNVYQKIRHMGLPFTGKIKNNKSFTSLTTFHSHLNKIGLSDKDDDSESGTIKSKKGPNSNGRFSREDVTEIETKIDSEYMPFSIHDLRTNEVVSLPAFIESVNDSFAVAYNSTHGYGRTDPIHNYSKTERNIDFSFHLVSFNSEDHEYMYQLVNKLVSLCYPQKSRGVLRKHQDTEFYQPSSQIQTASPMIRIRLGDLFVSNYSKTGFDNIFGNPKNKNIENIAQTQSNLVDTFNISDPFNNKYRILKGAEDILIIHPTSKFMSNFDYSSSTWWGHALENAYLDKNFMRGYSKEDSMLGKVVKAVEYEGMEYFAIELDNYYKISRYSVYGNETTNEDAARFARLEEMVNRQSSFDRESLSNSELIKSKLILVPSNQRDKMKLHREAKTEGNLTFQELTETASSTIMSNDLIHDNNNPLKRSFESTSGKGLAGFIKSLSLDYNGAAARWGINGHGDNSMTPKSIKVTVQFAPVHDLPLGLDYRGRLMAPSHPAGLYNRGNLDKLSGFNNVD